MPEMGRGIEGIITALCLVGIGFLTYKTSNPGATFLEAVLGFIFTFSFFTAVYRNSFVAGMVTVGALMGFGALLWQYLGFDVLGSGVLGGVCGPLVALAISPAR